MLNDSHIVVAKENIKNVWRDCLQFFRNVKESAANLTDLRILEEHLQIIFRDESEYEYIFYSVIAEKLNLIKRFAS